MSYDFSIALDTGGAEPHHIEPIFSDEHPGLSGMGPAGIALLSGARCGNYTSNVVSIWARCLTASLARVPEARRWVGAEDRRRIERWDPEDTGPWIHYIRHGRVPMFIHTSRLFLADLHDAPCDELIPLLRAAVEWGVEHIDELRELNPANGWGDAEGAVGYLWDIQRSCEAHPKGQLYLCR